MTAVTGDLPANATLHTGPAHSNLESCLLQAGHDEHLVAQVNLVVPHVTKVLLQHGTVALRHLTPKQQRGRGGREQGDHPTPMQGTCDQEAGGH